jgi:hypothetical protein
MAEKIKVLTMSLKYQKEFMQFLSEAKQMPDAGNAIFELSDEIQNAVLISGEILGKDTEQKLNKIAKKYGLLAMTNELTVLYRA